MNSWKQIVSVLLVSVFFAAAPLAQRRKPRKVPANANQVSPPAVVALYAKLRRFAPTVLTADMSSLSANDRKALEKIIAAAKYMDPLFRRQVWSGNEALLADLDRRKDPVWAHYFLINSGPWSR